MSEREEVLLEPGYVLHLRPYRNTSLIVECITASHGRQALVAQGARRSDARQRSTLQAFNPLRLSWIRRGEMGRLTHAESQGQPYALIGSSLLAAYYLNELLMKLVPRGDQNATILSCYSSCLERLAESASVARELRLFELDLIEALGFGIDLECDFQTGQPVEAGRHYAFELESGVTVSVSDNDEKFFRGEHLISLRQRELGDGQSLRAAQRLLGGILDSHLGGRPLKTRAVMHDIVSRGLTK